MIQQTTMNGEEIQQITRMNGDEIQQITTSGDEKKQQDKLNGDEKQKYTVYSSPESSSSSKKKTTRFASLVCKLDSYGVESRGIERITPPERSSNKRKATLQVLGLWLAASGGLSSLSSFILGPLLFQLGLRDSFIYGTFGQFVGCFVAAYCSIMGPRSGCRQMVSARYLFGWWFVKFIAFISILGVMGWSVTNSVLGGQILRSVSDNKCPVEVGIIIVALVSVVVSIFGIRQLLKVEVLLSIPILISFFLMYISMKADYKYLQYSVSTGEPDVIAGNKLSFFALAYSVTSTWGSIASDYYLVFPEYTKDWEVFSITFFGVLIPTTFTSVVGLLLGNIANGYSLWNGVYTTNGLGGLLTVAYTEHWGNGGKFFSVLLFLSLITNNIINCYSAAFGIQLAGRPLARIPRFIWVIVVSGIYLTAALIGRDHFSEILGNFLPMIGYWISIYFILLVEENLIFRNKWVYNKLFVTELSIANDNIIPQNYNWTIWNDYEKMTYGIAATLASLFGFAGAIVGMNQAYYAGPVGKALKGDVGMWLSMAFSAVVYPAFRYLELRYFKK